MKVKPAAAAGIFYPDNSDVLADMLARWLLGEPHIDLTPSGLIVPNISYMQCGAVSARAFSSLRHQSKRIKRVILLGPSTRYPVNGCVLPSHDAFSSPIGNVLVDADMRDYLLQSPWVSVDDIAHVLDYGLEVQLPFLQLCLTNFSILPIMVGNLSVENLVNILSLIPATADILFVVSVPLGMLGKDPDNSLVRLNDVLNGKKRAFPCQDTSLQSAETLLNGFGEFCLNHHWRLHCVAEQAASNDLQECASYVIA